MTSAYVLAGILFARHTVNRDSAGRSKRSIRGVAGRFARPSAQAGYFSGSRSFAGTLPNSSEVRHKYRCR
jgi:hypothetical protein